MLDYANEPERQRAEEEWADKQGSFVHLTVTGYLAGTPICGIKKQHAREQGDTFVHAAYAPLDNADWLPRVCPDCLEAWNDDTDN